MSDQISQDAGNTQATSTAQPAVSSGDSGAGVQTSAPTSSEATANTQQGTEGQTATEQDAAANTEGDGAKADDKPAGAPEKYEFKAPENKNFDPEVIEAYSTVAKELNLPQESAQKILDAIAPKIAERYEARQAEALQQFKADLVNQTKADKELGGDKLQENVAVAEKALAAFGTPELRKLLTDSGLSNHPEVIRAFFRAGKAISEDKFVPGGTAPPKGATNPAKALYPNQPA